MIQNLIIDFGGVLYNLAPGKTLELFNQYGSIHHTYNDLADLDIFKLYETNSISSIEFISSIRNIFGIQDSISDQILIDTWNKTLIGIFDFAIPTLLELKKRYNLSLLSNTNKLHYEYFMPHCQELFSIFDQCFFSHHISMRKPNTNIYKYVMSKMGYNPCNTMFIDDSSANIKGAQLAGVHTFKISPDTLLSDFSDTV